MECLGSFVGKQNPCPGQSTLASCHLLILLIETLIKKKCNMTQNETNQYPKNIAPTLKNNDNFDFIIIGGGTSGSIVASRLAEIPQWKILLIEAGDYPNILSQIPFMYYANSETSQDWNFTTEKTPSIGASLKGGVIKLTRGKVLGGSSAINPLIYMRGNKKDYDSWSGMGNQEWCYDCIKKLFERVENIKESSSSSTSTYSHYGRRGKLNLTQNMQFNEFQSMFEAIKSSLPSKELLYSKDELPLGYFDSYSNIYRGKRISSSLAYLNTNNNNLFVALNSHVLNIIIDKQTKQLKGVEVKTKYSKYSIKIYTKNEVILSAGAINSPKLLILSGIGPGNLVSSPLIKELNVGYNLQDHVGYPGFFVKLKLKTLQNQNTAEDIFDYLMKTSGKLARSDSFIGVINTKNHTALQGNILFYHKTFIKEDPFFANYLRGRFGLNEALIESLEATNKNNALLMIIPVLLNPKSVGFIEMRSKDSFSNPKIYVEFYSNEEDLNAMMDALSFLDELMKDDEIFKLTDGLVELNLTNCNKEKDANNNNFLRCALKELAVSMSEPVGTCKMGPEFDKTAVVDPQLQVYGIKGLRVIDASIMPKIISGDVTAATMMIAEKGAKIIKDSNMGCPKEEL